METKYYRKIQYEMLKNVINVEVEKNATEKRKVECMEMEGKAWRNSPIDFDFGIR
jgi:hypothetical protein